MRVFVTLTALLVVSWLPAAVRADVVTDWNEIVVESALAAGQSGVGQARSVAMVQVAVADAFAAIERRFAPYRYRGQAEDGASVDAAAATAAHRVLASLFPKQAKRFDDALQASLARVENVEARDKGVRVGEATSALIIAERKDDGSGKNDYRPFTRPGRYVPTPFPAGYLDGRLKPFALPSPSAFRAGPPFPLTSKAWARDFDEVKRLGGATGSERTPEQTSIGRFWEFVGPGTYNPMVRQISAARKLSPSENARLFALTAVAAVDGYIAVFDAKYAYNFWRPVTAIRNADLDGNPATDRDATWAPHVPTPMHPEYPCAHCIVQTSVATALHEYLGGDAIPEVKLVSPTAPGVVRTFDSLQKYVDEVIDARIYGGMHYRSSGLAGADMGRKVGRHVMRTQFVATR